MSTYESFEQTFEQTLNVPETIESDLSANFFGTLPELSSDDSNLKLNNVMLFDSAQKVSDRQNYDPTSIVPGMDTAKVEVESQENRDNGDGTFTTITTGDLNDGDFFDTDFTTELTVLPYKKTDKYTPYKESTTYDSPQTMTFGVPGGDGTGRVRVTADSVTVERDAKTGNYKVTVSPVQHGDGWGSPRGGYDTIILNSRGEVIALPSRDSQDEKLSAESLFRSGH